VGAPRSAVVEWRPDGSLATASVLIPDGSWIVVEPRAAADHPWGPVDRLWHAPAPGLACEGATPLTVLTAVDWARPAGIPTVEEPARIPPGGGTAVLNLLATLARERGVPRLGYAGPFPSEALFLSLLESFRPDAVDDPLACFARGELGWTPAPFAASLDEGVYVQWRERIEKVVWRAHVYSREDWGPVRRRAPLRVDDTAEGVRCALWALGEPIEDHLLLAPDGRLRAVRAPAAGDAPARPLRAAIRDGVIAIVVARSAAPLAQAIREVAASLAFTCGPVAGDLARVEGAEARVSTVLGRAIARRLRRPAPAEGRAQLALAALAEMATAVGDAVRARAQARLAAAPPAVQAAALERRDPDPAAATTITAAVAALLASHRVDDHPDVERDEGEDGDD
jgi:hypothetical protein